MGDIKSAIEWAVNVANDAKHGYDQKNRNGPDYDCSSFIATSLHHGGYNINPMSWTGNMLSQLYNEKFFICIAPWKPGDIHLNVNHHVCMSVNEYQVVEASLNEDGKTTGGMTGDQTGKEIYIRDYYDYRHGWDYHLRPPSRNAQEYAEVVRDVLMDVYGKGGDRINALIRADFNPKLVQRIINLIYNEGAK